MPDFPLVTFFYYVKKYLQMDKDRLYSFCNFVMKYRVMLGSETVTAKLFSIIANTV